MLSTLPGKIIQDVLKYGQDVKGTDFCSAGTSGETRAVYARCRARSVGYEHQDR